MSEHRRPGRATSAFFDDLEAQLGPERGPLGEPSVNDFQTFELLRIVEVFATEFDELPELFAGRPDYRLLMSTGLLVSRISVLASWRRTALWSSFRWSWTLTLAGSRRLNADNPMLSGLI